MKGDLIQQSRILVMHLGGLGDFVLTFPSIMALEETGLSVDVLAPASHGKLAWQLGLVDRWFPTESALFATLFGNEPDQRLNRALEFYTQIIAFTFSESLAKSLKKVSEAAIHRIPPRPDPKKRIHVALHLLGGIRASGLIQTAPAEYPEAFVWQRPADDIQKPLSRRCILVHPGSGSPKKNWPLTHYAKVIRHLDSLGIETKIVLGPAEASLKDALVSHKGFRDLIVSPPDLNHLLSLIVNASGFVGNDSGVSHLAGFCGLPAIVIFGPSDPIRWQPLGPFTRVVEPAGDCDPCFETDPDGCEASRCFGGISPGMVIEAIQNALFPQNVL